MESLLTVLILLSQTLTNLQIAYADTNPLTEWKNKLAMCESGGNWEALNPKDTDGTPSKGKFQFKDKTFEYFSKKYQIKTTSIWNGDEQEALLDVMINDPDVNLRNQFPACVKKIGLPHQVE